MIGSSEQAVLPELHHNFPPTTMAPPRFTGLMGQASLNVISAASARWYRLSFLLRLHWQWKLSSLPPPAKCTMTSSHPPNTPRAAFRTLSCAWMWSTTQCSRQPHCVGGRQGAPLPSSQITDFIEGKRPPPRRMGRKKSSPLWILNSKHPPEDPLEAGVYYALRRFPHIF